MEYVDKLSPAFRALVYEFGLLIVSNMREEEGYTNAARLRPVLEAWRSKRQEEWLATNYITPATSRSMQRIYERALGNGERR
jgi:hypothetical protein